MAQDNSKQNTGDARTPDKRIGEVKYADNKLAQKSELEGPAAYAPHNETPTKDKGDNRTPDEPIGEVAYANRDPAKKKTGEF
jgi:hypothetical protein